MKPKTKKNVNRQYIDNTTLPKNKKTVKAIQQSHGTIYNDEYKNRSRKKATYFTRNRKMVFEELVLFILSSFKCSTQCALRRFFATIDKPVHMKQQSLSEARAKLNVSAFSDLFEVSAAALIDTDDKLWHNYRVCAIDGSKIALPSDKTLLSHFGGTGAGASSPTAQASILYDVLNDIVINVRIAPLTTDERLLAELHIDHGMAVISGSNNVIIFDRGYPSFDLIKKLETQNIKYVMRCRAKFNLGIDNQESPDGNVRITKNDDYIYIRVIKLKLDNGEPETLITNTTDTGFSLESFKKLYFMRWPVETKYDIVKNKLLLENFTSRTVEGIEQDFYAVMYLTNIAATAAYDVNN